MLYGHYIISCATPLPSIHSDDRLDGYQKKKYVCKLLFIFLLGNDVDFGHQEAVNLLSSTRFSEKQNCKNSIVLSSGPISESIRGGGGGEGEREEGKCLVLKILV